MSLLYEKRIKHLEEVHRVLDVQIQEMEKSYGPDHKVEVLKKKKLKLKDQIADLQKEDND